MTTKAEKAEREEARAFAESRLRDLIREGDRIGTVVIYGHGQRDWVELFIPDGREILRITYWVSLVTGLPMSEKGIPRDGAQYDKAHDTVESLSRALFGKGQALTRDRMLG